jgi:Transposase C of IS166 homeodomain
MDGTLCYPLDASADQQRSLVPITLDPAATNHDHCGDTSDNARLGVLWQCYGLLGQLYWLAVGVIRRLRLQVIDLRCQANYWQAQHQRAVQREVDLNEQQQYLHAQIRDLQRRLFGRKSETSSSTQPQAKTAFPPHESKPRRGRGQQTGSKGHGRRHHDHLPAEHESCTLPPEQRCCPYCQEPFEEIPGTADGNILEVEVRSHRRCYHRQRYRRH